MNPYQKIAAVFLTVAALWIFAQWFVRWCKRVDGRPAYDPLRDGPVDYGRGVAPAEDDWEGLHLAGPVPLVSTPTINLTKARYDAIRAEEEVQRQMLADTLRVSKLQ